MTDNKTAIANGGMTGERDPASGRKTKPYISDERRKQDALEDDEVWEALQSLHRSLKHAAPAT
jgi:hypothetical protein